MSTTAATDRDRAGDAIGRWFHDIFATVDGTPSASRVVTAGVYPLRVSAPDPAEVAVVIDALCGGAADPDGSGPTSPMLDVAVVGPHELASPLPTGMMPAPGETHRVLIRDAGRWAYGGGDGVVWMLDANRRRGLRWAGPPGPPDWERCSPLRHVLSWWAGVQGGALVHAAAVSTDAGAALLVGPGGSGKSTTALACLGSPVTVLADDYCVLTTGPRGDPFVAPLYRHAKVDRYAIDLVPSLAERRTGEVVVGKDVILVDPPSGAGAVAPVVAVCATSVAPDGVTAVTPAGRAAVLRRLAPSTLSQSAGVEHETWAMLTGLARHATAFDLRVGRDLSGMASVLAGVIDRAVAGR